MGLLIELMEMAASHRFTSGMFSTRQAKDLVKAFKAGKETYDLKDGRRFVMEKSSLPGNKLEKGMLVMASYAGGNQGAGIYEILGFTDDDEKYGKGGVKFDSVAKLFKEKNVTSLKALEELQNKNGYGYHSYLVIKDLEDGDEGPWFYPFEGHWVRGSGAEKLSFTLVKEIK